MRHLLLPAALATAALVTAVPAPAGADQLCESVTVVGTTVGDCVPAEGVVAICTSVTGLEPVVGATVCVPFAVQRDQPNTAR